MLGLFSFLFGVIAIVILAAAGIKIGLMLLLAAFCKMSSNLVRSLSLLVLVGVAAATVYLVAPLLVELLPDFHKPGDGGFGIGLNLIAQPMTYILTGVAAGCIGSAMLLAMVHFQSGEIPNSGNEAG